METEIRYIIPDIEEAEKLIDNCYLYQTYEDLVRPLTWDVINNTEKVCTSFSRLRKKSDNNIVFTYKAGSGASRVEIEKEIDTNEFKIIRNTMDSAFLVKQTVYHNDNLPNVDIKKVEIIDRDEFQTLRVRYVIEKEFNSLEEYEKEKNIFIRDLKQTVGINLDSAIFAVLPKYEICNDWLEAFNQFYHIK